MVANRVWLTPFSAPPESPGSPEVNSATAGAKRCSPAAFFQINTGSPAELTRIIRGNVRPTVCAGGRSEGYAADMTTER